MSVFITASNPDNSTGNNFIKNPNAEINTAFWNLYDNSGRTVPASLTNQDLTYTSTLSGAGGNGVIVEYVYNASFPASTPNINVISPTHVQVQWNNGPTIANNPTATQLKAAWDAVGAATTIATVAITGTASNRQYIMGSELLANGGDTAPTNGTGGTPVGVTFTRNTVNPLAGVADFLLSKDATSREGMGVSTDFEINNADKGKLFQVSFVYDSASGMAFGANSDLRVWIYDIINAVLIPITPRYTLIGPVATIVEFVGEFTASTSSAGYRLILHIGTTNATTWTINFDEVTVTDVFPQVATEVPSLVLNEQPISGAVTDHMVVMWRDGATQWVPATIVGATIPAFGTDTTQLGFATNIDGSQADIYIRGKMDGFSFGPFTGYDQYIDNTAGGISPLPSPFTDLYCSVGKAISSTVLNIQFAPHVNEISNGSGVPLKGGILTSNGVNDGTGDIVLPVGANGNALIANSAAADGIQWAPAVVVAAPFTYTTATRTLTAAVATNSVAGFLSAADHTTFAGYAASIALKANIASPTFTGTVTIPTPFTLGAVSVTATGTQMNFLVGVTSAIQTQFTAKAPLASPVFTGDVNASTGNVLVSTIGKGLQIKTGTNAKIGSVTLVGGTATVANSSITANSLIFLTEQTTGGTVGFTRISAKTVGTSFTITSSNPLDTSVVAWMIVESIP